MGKRREKRLMDDDFLDDLDYDQFSDDELDQLYQFGEIRRATPRLKSVRKPRPSRLPPELDDIDADDWGDTDVDDMDELMDD